MRNTLQEQYNLIKEGKGNKNFFLKTALRQFPHLITPTLGFDMTVNILKQRQVISEVAEGIVTKDVEQDWIKIFKNSTINEVKIGNPEEAAKKALGNEKDSLEESHEYDFYEEEYGNEEINSLLKKLDYLGFDNLGQAINALLTEPISNWDLESDDLSVIKKWKKTISPKQIDEAKEVKAKIAKTDTDVINKETAGYDYKDKKNYDNVYGQEFLTGYYCEMKDPKNAEKSVDELKKIVAKNLESDCNYYVKKGQFGIKDLGYTDNHPGLGPTKEVKGKYKSSGMEPVKIKESIIKKIDFLIKEGLDLKEIEKVAEVAALEAKMSKVSKEKEKREKKIKALETLAEMDKEVVSKEGLNTLKKEIKLLEKMASDIQKKMDKHAGIKKEVVTDTEVSEENLDNMSETEETEN
jgi:hypothetical protein